MREIKIEENEAGQRLDKFLAKYMKKAPRSFFYKMMRKKNIVLNGRKALGNEKLSRGDVVRLFLSDETIDSFSDGPPPARDLTAAASGKEDGFRLSDRNIVYEDDHILLINKPAGILSQRADSRELSMTEYVIRYLLEGRCVPPSGTFVTYRDVPWGEVYFRNFQGRCLARLAFGFGNRLEDFRRGMERLHAAPVPSGDAAYQLEFLHNLFVRFILWAGDQEFPPSSQILFSDNFPQAFRAEDMAVVGDIAIGTLKEIAK